MHDSQRSMPGRDGPYRPHGLRLAATVLVLCLAPAACRQEPPAPAYVARLGDEYLTHEELEDALQTIPVWQDSAVARNQIVEQWVTNTLLFREAQRLGLQGDPDVQRLLQENERSVLVSALLARLYDEEPAAPTPSELQTYYERHKEQLRLREPFVRVRYLSSTERDSAEAALALLRQASADPAADSLWRTLLMRFADDPEGSRTLSGSYFAESRLFQLQPALTTALAQLRPGQTAPLIDVDGHFHVLQLVDRRPAGTIPELAWVADELRQRLTIQARKQIYARQVQRLRNEALAREALEIH